MRTDVTNLGRAATVLVLAGVWCVAAWLLYRTSVPSLHLGGLDPHDFFSARQLSRARSYSLGADGLWLADTVLRLVALGVLIRVLPRRARTMGLGALGTAVIVGFVILSTLWFVSFPFQVAGLWWAHHWGLGPFDVVAALGGEWAMLGSEAVFVMATIMIVVGLARRFRRRWPLALWPVFLAVASLFAFSSGYLGGAGSHAVQEPWLRSDIGRIERAEQVSGTPVGVEDVSSYTNEVNAFTVGFGASTHVVLWNTLLDGSFTHDEVDVVVAHELGHVRSRHVLKSLGWTALLTLPVALLLGAATRRRGGLADPANLPYALLVFTVLTLVLAPAENLVSRRYEAEADWRALNATHDPGAMRQLFVQFATSDLEEPDPGTLDYLWLENHPTLLQRIAMARQWTATRDARSRAAPGSP
jgi:STE24 endopeptidase